MAKNGIKTPLINLSVEEESLATVPFAVLERRVGKRVGKIELKGTKILPDGQELKVTWQVQGNADLGLPTEQDLDIFVALGVLTFRNNFAKTVNFTGREIARILNIGSVHGKFYKRLKVAMDRFIPLRFRALAESDQQEQVKWLNVFQEASFSLDRNMRRCTGSITWTDKLIQSMDNGFFRVLDAGRYMELDGITAKHLYRFLAVAFEKTDLIVIDARNLSTEHLGILNPPKYFSRLMQTLEPAFEQLVRIQVLGTYHVVAPDQWQIALHRHPSYEPERKILLLQGGAATFEFGRSYCQSLLEKAGFSPKIAAGYTEAANSREEFYALGRTAQLLQAMKDEEVLPHVAMSVVRRALDLGAGTAEATEILDWTEIAVEICRYKKRLGQNLKNGAGLLIKIIKDPEMRRRLVNEETEASYKQRFRKREKEMARQEEKAEERTQILEYEEHCHQLAAAAFADLTEAVKQALRKEKRDLLHGQDRFERLAENIQEQETDALILRDLARKEAAPFERWRLRKQAGQAMLPFDMGDNSGAIM